MSFLQVESIVSDVFKSTFNVIGFKPFLLHQPQGFPQHVVCNVCEQQQEELMKDVNRVPIEEVPDNASVISSNTV